MQVIQASSLVSCENKASEKGYNIDPKATEAVILFKSKIPRTVGEIRRVIGLLGVYRRHIKDFSKIAKPIYELLEGKANTNQNSRKNGQLPSNHPIQWCIKHQTALNTLIDCVTSPPILAYPDYSSPLFIQMLPRTGWEPCYISVKAERSESSHMHHAH
jgi:hypothetical protein